MYIDVFFAPPVPLFRTTCYVMYAQSAKQRLWRFPGALKIELLSSATLTNLASLLHTCIGQERPFEHSLNTVLLWVCVSTYFFSGLLMTSFVEFISAAPNIGHIRECQVRFGNTTNIFTTEVWRSARKTQLSSLKFAGTQILSSLLSRVFCVHLTQHNQWLSHEQY